MAPEPDILLLDEPTNHLDLGVIEWLEGELSRMSSAVVLISHDRRFLERVSREAESDGRTAIVDEDLAQAFERVARRPVREAKGASVGA